MLDTSYNKKCVGVVGPIAASTDQSGVVNRSGFESLMFLFRFGIGGITFDGSNKLDGVLSHSDDGVTYTAVAAADVVITLPDGTEGAVATGGVIRSLQAAHAAASVTKVGYIGNKPYVKATADFTGTHGSPTPVDIIAILENGPRAMAGV